MFEDKKESGIYSFNLEELSDEKIILDDQNREKYLIGTFTYKTDS